MGNLSKNLMKSLLSNIRYVYRNYSSSINPSLYIPRHHHSLKIDLLVRRFDDSRTDYFSALSTAKGENLPPKCNLYLPFSKIGRPSQPHFVAGCCNGLLCLDDMEGNIVLWNPSTNQLKFLPRSPAQGPGGLSTSEDTFMSSCFWFDPKSKDYKVLRSFYTSLEDDLDDEDEEGGRDQIHVELYSLNSDSWKEISNLGPLPSYPCPPACVNGRYYWLTYGGRIAGEFIFSFDTANESYSILPLPDIAKSLLGPNDLRLLDFDGLLCAVVYPNLGTEKRFDLWVMNGSWTRESTIHVPGAERPLGFCRKGELLFFESINRELMVFDRTTGELKNLGIYSYPRTMQLIPYVESLVPLNGKSEREEHLLHQPDIGNEEK